MLNVDKSFIQNNYQAIVIPSIRTPKKIIEKAQNYFDSSQIVIQNVDKKAYLSSLQLADHIIVTVRFYFDDFGSCFNRKANLCRTNACYKKIIGLKTFLNYLSA